MIPKSIWMGIWMVARSLDLLLLVLLFMSPTHAVVIL